MYEVASAELKGNNYYAGTFPVARDTLELADSAEITARTPVALTADGAAELTKTTLANFIGIAAADSANGYVTIDCTGEIFADAVNMPEGVTIDDLKPVARKLNIYLR